MKARVPAVPSDDVLESADLFSRQRQCENGRALSLESARLEIFFCRRFVLIHRSKVCSTRPSPQILLHMKNGRDDRI